MLRIILAMLFLASIAQAQPGLPRPSVTIPASKVSITGFTATDLQSGLDSGEIGAGGGLTSDNIHHPVSGDLSGGIYTLTACSPAIVSNSAVGVAMTVKLCAALTGMEVWVVWEDASKNLIIEPNGSDTISTPEVSGAGDGLSWTATGTVGSIVHLISLANNEWRVFEIKGSAPADNNSGP